ncbi:hypothetical protein ACFL3F_05195, partial [Planctomycetota bacterium]
VPAAALKAQQRKDKYGHVEGLPDEELADPDELERTVYRQMWWPIFALPKQSHERTIKPAIDENGNPDYGAFATVDFEAYKGSFDKAGYAERKMNEQLKDYMRTLKITSARLPRKAKRAVLNMVRKEVLDIGEIRDWDMYFLAEGYLRACRLQREIEQLQKRRRQRQAKALRQWLE